jgi:aldehyde dehydrogenase (NAD(P)+)
MRRVFERQSNIAIGNMGQICTSTSRIYVQEAVYEGFLSRFVEYTKENSIVGNPFDSNVTHGPQVSKLQQEKILSYVETTKKEGARLLHGGDSPSGQGYFVNPTIFADVRDDMTAVREEIFGPFVVIQSFKTEEEVVEKANDSEYGLGAAIFTQDITRGHTISAAIEAGMVWVSDLEGSLGELFLTASIDQQLPRLPFWYSFWWREAERDRSRARPVRSLSIHAGQGCPW